MFDISGPIERTVDDFWLMIWEQKPSGIVMVTKLFELTRVIVVHNYIPYTVFTKMFFTRQDSDTNNIRLHK